MVALCFTSSSPQKSDVEFRQVLLQIEPINDQWKAYGISQSKECCLPPGQRQTSRLFANSTETGRVWLGCSTIPAVLNWPFD